MIRDEQNLDKSLSIYYLQLCSKRLHFFRSAIMNSFLATTFTWFFVLIFHICSSVAVRTNWINLNMGKNHSLMLSYAYIIRYKQLMVTSLHNLETELSINIFNIALRLIAHQLDDFFIDSMIMNTKFSTGGASQFDFDMNRNLFALFGQYARRPDLLFKK